jgi:DNA-nicking Smr family endonuclease
LSRKEHDRQSAADAEHEDDVQLFRRRMSDARPLQVDAVPPSAARPAPRARFAQRDAREALRESLEPDGEEAEIESGESLSFARPSVGRRSFRKLARGGFSIRAEIDLHGMTSTEARQALGEFIASSIDRGHLCVRVIHGKGLGSGGRGPVLKRKVDAWLRRWDTVLAYVSARRVDGGTGAVYVLLRKD